jgi:hypothetical protein
LVRAEWLREWNDTTPVPAAVVDGTPEERARQYESLVVGFLILDYEQLLRDAEHIQALVPEIVVLDEAQRIKNYATKSALYVKALSPEYRLVLTGTPMENRLDDARIDPRLGRRCDARSEVAPRAVVHEVGRRRRQGQGRRSQPRHAPHPPCALRRPARA